MDIEQFILEVVESHKDDAGFSNQYNDIYIDDKPLTYYYPELLNKQLKQTKMSDIKRNKAK